MEWGGAERQLIALATQLDSRNHDVTIAVFYSKAELYEGLEGTKVRVISLNKTSRWDLIGFGTRLVRLIREERPDVLHTYLPGPNVLAALVKPLCPRIPLVWGVRSSFMDLGRYDWLSKVFDYLERSLSRVPSLIICNSIAGRSVCILRGFPAHLIHVIPNGIDTSRFEFDGTSGTRLRKDWDITDDQILIGLVARNDPMKDVDLFISAAELAVQSNSSLRFVCIGRGYSRGWRDSRNLALQFVDAQNDMPGVYSALDLLCSSSRGEGFSNVIAEAMSCSRPCVVTDVGDSASIVGETGWVVPPEKPQLLAQAFLEAAGANRSELGYAARSRIVANFALERLGRDTEAALAGLIACDINSLP